MARPRYPCNQGRKMSKGRTEPVTRENGAPLHEALGYERRGYWFPDGALMLVTWTEGFDGEWDFDPVDGTETFEPETVEALRVLLNEHHAARATPAVVPRPCVGKHDPALVCPYCVCPSCGLDGKEHRPGCAAAVPLGGTGRVWPAAREDGAPVTCLRCAGFLGTRVYWCSRCFYGESDSGHIDGVNVFELDVTAWHSRATAGTGAAK